jgi:hypothetical protein
MRRGYHRGALAHGYRHLLGETIDKRRSVLDRGLLVDGCSVAHDQRRREHGWIAQLGEPCLEQHIGGHHRHVDLRVRWPDVMEK